ncbi:MAG TPA: sulfurtransferase TusA family protein [Clostridia bacterium]|nr:sulfurtransferase TusA family protein [Clostridia bacterium]
MKKIDCLGDMCPIPVLMSQKAYDESSPGESFMLVSDHSCVVESVQDHFKNKSVSLSVDEVMNGIWEITFTMK